MAIKAKQGKALDAALVSALSVVLVLLVLLVLLSVLLVLLSVLLEVLEVVEQSPLTETSWAAHISSLVTTHLGSLFLVEINLGFI